MKKLIFLTGLLPVFILQSCFTASKPVINKQTFNFDYSTQQTESPGSAAMSLALIRPRYASDFSFAGNELFRRFTQSLGSDMEELLIAKGFTLKGPYLSSDEMVFDDRKRTDVGIDIEIAPEFSASQGGWKQNFVLYGSPTYSYEGTTSLIGKINITGKEVLTGEKIWSKSVVIPDVINIPVRSSRKYTTPDNTQLLNDPNVYNELGKALQSQYKGIMDKIAAHFAKEELRSLLPQVKELKSKKGY